MAAAGHARRAIKGEPAAEKGKLARAPSFDDYVVKSLCPACTACSQSSSVSIQLKSFCCNAVRLFVALGVHYTNAMEWRRLGENQT